VDDGGWDGMGEEQGSGGGAFFKSDERNTRWGARKKEMEEGLPTNPSPEVSTVSIE